CGPPVVTMRSTLSRTKSAASSGARSGFCSANRYSIVIFFPSLHPSLLSSCRNASRRTAMPEAVLASRNPMRATFPGCCASAIGAVDSRAAATRQVIIFVFIGSALPLPNHLIRSRQYIRRNCQADLLGGLEIDHELELHRLLHGEIGGLGSFQDL